MTGAHNRRYFMRHLHRELNRVSRFGGELSLLLLDIDHFKRINDGHGHSVGDEVLKDFVRRITSSLPRESDWCARLGGEEFAVVLPQTDLAGAGVVAERLRSAIAGQPMQTTLAKVAITASIGVSSLQSSAPGAQVTVEGLLDQADRCLYASKDGGRNRVTLAELEIRG
jgi:diguanylate cyclase (GGDEF)-like protein